MNYKLTDEDRAAGYVEWDGGSFTEGENYEDVPPGLLPTALVDVIHRDGYCSAACWSGGQQEAIYWGWWHDGDETDIIAYKVLGEDK